MKYYDEISKGYNSLHRGEQQKKAALIKANCRINGFLLDIGAGTGLATKLFEDKAECIALDPAKEMLKQFSGLKVVGKAEELPFKDASFDSIVSITALHHAGIEKAKSEIDRVAKPNACIALSFFKRSKKLGLAKALFKSFRQLDSEKDLIFFKP